MRIFRTYARIYTQNLDEALMPLQAVAGERVDSRFSLPNGLESATVGRVLVLAGDEQTLRPFTATAATLIVDDLDESLRRLNEAEADIIRGPQEVPTGRNLTAELPGGVRIEYVEWDEAQWERAGGKPV